ncbi:hypothetical protein V6N13_102336 [Hibiscus sabdariffa]|uniref:Uncharacterized protein n=1 Tax=Hibiscus sabdariffa TaxID=183260 RepID=A0ABR2D3Q6_9ROSI
MRGDSWIHEEEFDKTSDQSLAKENGWTTTKDGISGLTYQLLLPDNHLFKPPPARAHLPPLALEAAIWLHVWHCKCRELQASTNGCNLELSLQHSVLLRPCILFYKSKDARLPVIGPW